jgi:hypothetical protein
VKKGSQREGALPLRVRSLKPMKNRADEGAK